MADDTLHLKHLLLRALPLERVGPVLRARARRAALEGHAERMRAVARQVVTDLLRRGDLLPVAAQHDGLPQRTLHLVRSTSRLVDLGALTLTELAAPDPVAASSGVAIPVDSAPVIPATVLPEITVPPADTVVPPAEAEAAAAIDLSLVAALLGAMEEAQDLEIGDPLSTVPQVVLGGILALLERHLPTVRLVLQLDHVDPGRPCDRRVVARGAALAGSPFWLRQRRPGSLAVLPDAAELPLAVREVFGILAPGTAIVAVPLVEPAEIGTDAGSGPPEKGILFAATAPGPLAASLLPVARQLTAFVTRRWRQQWTVNQRIHTDSLTGVHNRAFFDIQLPIELERARRGSFPLALVLGDLDWFKRVNDTHGHHCGDLMLQEVARGLQGALRRIDTVCRIGGEEFALVLPHTTVAEAAEVMGRLLSQPFSILVPGARDGLLSVTMSYGVVTYPEGGADAADLYRKADAMLYLSKDQGRNRCHFWRSDGNPLPLAAAADAD